MSALLLEELISSRQKLNAMKILLKAENFTVLFDALQKAKEEKRILLSNMIRHMYLDNLEGMKLAFPLR